MRLYLVQHGEAKTGARQTAEIWAEVLGVPLDQAEGLAPLDDPKVWAARLDTGEEDLMLAGHLPHLARLAGLLLAVTPSGLQWPSGREAWSAWSATRRAGRCGWSCHPPRSDRRVRPRGLRRCPGRPP